MNNYEAIKKMSLKQMAYTFYLMVKPFMARASDADRKAAYNKIEEWLMQEVPKGKRGGSDGK